MTFKPSAENINLCIMILPLLSAFFIELGISYFDLWDVEKNIEVWMSILLLSYFAIGILSQFGISKFLLWGNRKGWWTQ
jgi:hypothetical protein